MIEEVGRTWDSRCEREALSRCRAEGSCINAADLNAGEY